MFDLWVTTWVHFNIQYSTVDRFQDEDGFYYKVNGIEKNESLWDSQTIELKKVKIYTNLQEKEFSYIRMIYMDQTSSEF
ncbi:hypothetical protein LEP1GSC083_4856 [Leptospira interrogans serovar Pyrogenes str. L0374]|uniref:Uncharacterized protein n=1 Tax=Leptospira interrogans serovar Pyrogenes str. L0374 TaxID=1049928 RepID=M6K294_LEPIR|nr:hypothetical protein LEP1GSC083_4856 [Leptospira interrogans serovar Pyrogenes str. L0374]